jgi:hypothetical protein
MSPRDVHVEIDFTRGVEPVSGRVTGGLDGAAQEFSGWMELVAALDSVRGGTRALPQGPDEGMGHPR